MLRILIADDHFLVRKGLRQLLEEHLPVKSVDEAGEGREALELASASRYDLVILDFSMPGMDGLDLIKELRARDAGLHILVLSILPEEQYAVRAFKLGASGCINKAVDPAELLEAVKTVAEGHRYLSQRARDLVVDTIVEDREEPHARLSDREFQILRLLASGRSVGEIARLCSLSVKTVSTYRTRMLEKMGMENNNQLICYAFKHGLAGQDQGV
ncbi:MAG TPA: response regulator transcription factor [Spirochaetales bacterium]|nr:response regulator transcription factor [Spirochaetales bacterium]HRY55635.1 response regulator transcription factor [Spirochaetia bacterium]HRZ64503.1 response regulator transcription factor [Spirochaetia bacterium]